MTTETTNAARLPPNILITGAWRSGTTLLYLVFPLAFKDVVAASGESDALDTLLPAAYRWRVSKRPNDIHRLRTIRARLDPYVIYLLRDPRDCIVSWRAARGQYYLAFNEWMRNRLFAESVPTARVLDLRFETLVRQPAEAQRQILNFIPGLEARQDIASCCAQIDRNSPILHQLVPGRPASGGPAIRSLDPDMIGAWRRDKARIRQQLRAFPELQAALEKYGYEPDDAWQAELEDV